MKSFLLSLFPVSCYTCLGLVFVFLFSFSVRGFAHSLFFSLHFYLLLLFVRLLSPLYIYHLFHLARHQNACSVCSWFALHFVYLFFRVCIYICFLCTVCGVYVCCLCIVVVGLAIFSFPFILVFQARVGRVICRLFCFVLC